jgi:YVTN family beta-propeller protein
MPGAPRNRRLLLPAVVLIALAAAAAAAAVLLLGRGHGGTGTVARPPTTARDPVVAKAKPKRPPLFTERTSGTLPAPLRDPSPAAVGTRMILAGGLTSADTSSDGIVSADTTSAHTIGRLPSPRHDTAAAALGGSVYVFGGGNGTSQLDEIVRVDPASGTSTVVGHLPTASSDSAAAAVGGSAWVVGGYTGSRWLDTIVAWRPGASARVVAHLPFTVRYAAVTAVGDGLVIAGGSLENGTASRAVLEYLPASHRLVRLGNLPAPTTHAAAATAGGIAYILGGRGASLGSVSARIVAVDPRTRKIRNAGRLRTARSDLAAATLGGKIVVAGGEAAGGNVDTITTLVAVRHLASSETPTVAHAIDPANVYAHDTPTGLVAATRRAKDLVYVPNSRSDTVDVIDPHTYRIVEHFAVGVLPQHVVPAWNLRTLYVTNDVSNSLTAIDPRTGKPGRTIPVDDPYNMYFTPDGRYAIVVAERLRRLDFRNATTFALHRSLAVPCSGVDHMDFSADERYLLASCEFSGQIVKVDVRSERVVGVLTLPDGAGGMPQDVKLSPDGKVFYVADMRANGLWEIDGRRLKVIGFLHTGAGTHGLYPSRDARYLYVSNRSEGSISVVSFRTRKVVRTWRIPGGGSPDMGGVSADGKVLWLSGRYNGVVYAISTRTGRLLARIPVGLGPHGVCVWPQPGRYSLGHTGILR